MISPELLRRFPFFGFLDDTQLKAVAMLAEEVEAEQGTSLFESEQTAVALYVMVDGSIDLNYKVIDRDDPRIIKEFFISELNPGDIFGLSAIVEPFVHTTTAKVLTPGKVIKIEATGLRALSELDVKLQAGLMKATAKAAMDRLNDTRVQLAAARA
ncbi:MAG TPA: cyclic nucleotide-binding domain-containing protein [Anaerolineae bacterium]|nr:cyclic nucleotide-binding domain-containing protein [Anaerolineae bacterium]